MKARWITYPLQFVTPAQTSRNTMLYKDTWFLIIEENGRIGIGEAGLIPGLSMDDPGTMEQALEMVCRDISGNHEKQLLKYPSVNFALETARLSFQNKDPFFLFDNDFSRGDASIKINGLIWMGDKAFMKAQITDKINQGFKCLKLKIGALDFESELSLLKYIRDQFTEIDIEIRLDANGAFDPENALKKLDQLSKYQIHSLEQPIASNQPEEMRDICTQSPIPIALDEELIGVAENNIESLLTEIQPHYIILKPSLLGGFRISDKWIAAAEKLNIGWWVTSALESNLGLNAIAQWIAGKSIHLPQGLGTGQLYSNNLDSPLNLKGDQLNYSPKIGWDINSILSWEAIS